MFIPRGDEAQRELTDMVHVFPLLEMMNKATASNSENIDHFALTRRLRIKMRFYLISVSI